MSLSKLFRLFLVSVIFLSIVFITNQKVFGQNWTLVGLSTAYDEWYIDLSSISKVSSTNKRVWVKFVTSPEEMIKSKIKKDPGYESFSHSLIYYEFNCVEKSFDILSNVDYDKSGNILKTKTYTNHTQTFIVPGSIYEGVCKAVCRYSIF